MIEKDTKTKKEIKYREIEEENKKDIKKERDRQREKETEYRNNEKDMQI